MPIFEYECTSCHNRFEDFVIKSTDEAGVACPSCGNSDVRKLMSSFAASMGPTDAPCGPGGCGVDLGGGCGLGGDTSPCCPGCGPKGHN